MNPESNPSAPAPEPALSSPKPSARIRVFGVGAAGVNVVEQAIGAGLPAADCVAVDLRPESVAASAAARKLSLETPLLRGLGTGGDPERGRNAAREREDALKEACAGAAIVVLVTGLGGGAGTGICPLLARAAREAGALVLAFVILPFECEGTLRCDLAAEGLTQLRREADLVVSLPNQRALALIDEATSLVATFRNTNLLLGQCIRAAVAMFSGESVMGMPLRDLCVLVRSRSSEILFGAAEALGPNRATEALEGALAHPMFGGPDNLRAARTLAVCVSGGPGLTMLEVNGVMERMKALAPEVPAVMGAVIHPGAGDRLAVGLLVASSMAEEASEPATTPRGTSGATGSLETHLLDSTANSRPQSRFVAPAPSLPQERMEQLLARQSPGAARSRKGSPKLRQAQLPLEIISKGRFDKSEPTIHKGEDLDVPTYIRRGVNLN